jgi:hypothetical protein
MERARIVAVVGVCVAFACTGAVRGEHPEGPPRHGAQPVVDWSQEARRAIVPAGPNGVFGPENYGNKFPGEAAVYMGIVHAAIYDAALAVEGGGDEPYAIALHAPHGTSAAAAVATAAHHTLIGLQPALGLTPPQQAILDGDYAGYLAAIPDDHAKADGVAVGERVAAAILARRAHDGRERNPSLADLSPPAPGPGVWDAGAAPALGLRLPGMRPLALHSASQFRPRGPFDLTSARYAHDVAMVAALGRADSTTRTESQTAQALFWTDHDLRQWNDGLLALAHDTRLDLVETARLLALAHVSGGDAMIACFDAKYVYWFWRPFQAIVGADTDGNDDTTADPAWTPLRATPNFPEYPSAHGCHTGAISEALRSFYGTDRVPLALDSRATGTSHHYRDLDEVVSDVNLARVLVGFHFRDATIEGSALGREVARYVVRHEFRRSEREREHER